MHTRPAVRNSFAAWCIVASVLAFGVETLLLLGSQIDDPYIFARYARNFWRYGDFLWNPGEPRVEGFSSWLWLMVYVLGIRIMPDPVVFARMVGMVLGCLLVASFAREVLRESAYRIAGGGALVLLLGSPALPYYAGCGMDHIAWVLVIWLYLLWLARAPVVGSRHAVVAGMCLLVRPEGFLVFVPLAALCALEELGSTRPISLATSVARRLAPGVAVMAAIVLLRRLLFGAWLPTAAAAKHLGGSLLLRAISGTLYTGHGVALYLALPTVALVLCWHRLVSSLPRHETSPRSVRREVVAASAFCVALVGFTIIAGGDDPSTFGLFRLLSPAITPATYVLYLALRDHASGRKGLLQVGLIVMATLVGRAPAAKATLQEATAATNITSASELLSAWRRGLVAAPELPISTYLKTQTPPGEYVALPFAGIVPFQTDLLTIDTHGLNDVRIAESPSSEGGVPASRYDPDYVLSRHPYFICDSVNAHGSLVDLQKLSDGELRTIGAALAGQRAFLRHPLLLRDYEIDNKVPWTGSPWLGTCFRRNH